MIIELVMHLKLETPTNIFLTTSVRQAGVAVHCAVTLEDSRPLDRHASGYRIVKF